MKIKLGDWLNSINVGKNNLMEGGENIEDYSPFIINKCIRIKKRLLKFKDNTRY